MTKKDAERYVEQLKYLEFEITSLETIKISNMTLAQIYGKLALLQSKYYEHKQLSEKIKRYERLA